MAKAILWKKKGNIEYYNPCKTCTIPFDERQCSCCTQSEPFKEGFVAKITERNGYTSIKLYDNPCNGCSAAGKECNYCLPLELLKG